MRCSLCLIETLTRVLACLDRNHAEAKKIAVGMFELSAEVMHYVVASTSPAAYLHVKVGHDSCLSCLDGRAMVPISQGPGLFHLMCLGRRRSACAIGDRSRLLRAVVWVSMPHASIGAVSLPSVREKMSWVGQLEFAAQQSTYSAACTFLG